MTEIFIILGLILLNGLFAMAEIALISARKARLEVQAQKGDARAREALTLANNPDKFLSTVQIGITLMGILTGIFSGENLKGGLIEFFNRFDSLRNSSGTLATFVVVIIITYLSLISELMAKRVGLSRPEKLAKIVAAPMRFISLVTYPFIWLLTNSTQFLANIFGIKPAEGGVTEEEIKAIINEGTEHGTVETAEKEIIERLFHLGDRYITSLMTHRSDIEWFDVNETVGNIKDQLGEVVHSSYPVCDGSVDKIKGVVSVKDLLLKPEDTPVRNIMEPGLFVPENNSAYQVLEKFKGTHIQTCFIVDEYGSLEGMITLNDILEAIVGDIAPEDDDDYVIVERNDGTFLVDAQIPFYDFLSHFNRTEWMHEGEQEFDTLAGFILHRLQRIPYTGDTFEWKGFQFEIIDMDSHRIDKVLITLGEELKEPAES